MSKNIHVLFGAKADNGVEGEFGVDDDCKLYWNGKPIVTQQKVTLQWWVSFSAILAAIGTTVSAVVAVFTYFK